MSLPAAPFEVKFGKVDTNSFPPILGYWGLIIEDKTKKPYNFVFNDIYGHKEKVQFHLIKIESGETIAVNVKSSDPYRTNNLGANNPDGKGKVRTSGVHRSGTYREYTVDEFCFSGQNQLSVRTCNMPLSANVFADQSYVKYQIGSNGIGINLISSDSNCP